MANVEKIGTREAKLFIVGRSIDKQYLDSIKVKILRIEMERKRLGLSLKQADETDSGDHTFVDDGYEDE